MSLNINQRRGAWPDRTGFGSYPTFIAYRRAWGLLTLPVLLLPLPGCQSITGNPSISEVRVIDASPDAPSLDIYQGSSVVAYNLSLGTITSYVTLAPGTYGIQSDSAGTRQHLVSAQGSFVNGNQYTIIVGNYLNALQEIILKDQNTPAPAGQINVRFVDRSTRGGALDLYLVPTGLTVATVKPVLTGLGFNANTGYVSIAAGTYTLIALPTGTVPSNTETTAYTGPSVTYSSGAARTFVMIDHQSITIPGIQVVVGNDYDPPSATN